MVGSVRRMHVIRTFLCHGSFDVPANTYFDLQEHIQGGAKLCQSVLTASMRKSIEMIPLMKAFGRVAPDIFRAASEQACQANPTVAATCSTTFEVLFREGTVFPWMTNENIWCKRHQWLAISKGGSYADFDALDNPKTEVLCSSSVTHVAVRC